MHKPTSKMNTASSTWFFFTIVYLIIDYARPQDILPIGFLRPGMISIVILTLFLLFAHKLHYARSTQTTLMLLFVGLLVLFVPFARNNYYAFHTALGMVLYLPFIASTIICVTSLRRLKTILYVYLALMVCNAVYCQLHQGMGSGGYFQDENDLSLYINTFLPFCFFLFPTAKNLREKLLYLSGLLLGTISVVITFSRGGFIGLVCIAFVVWLLSPKKFISSVTICLLGALFYLYSTETYWKEISTITDTKEGTAIARIESWKSGWNMFAHNPWGVGGGNFKVRFYEYQTDYFQRGMWGRAAHSLWVELFTELGVVGALIYFILLYHNVHDLLWLKKLKKRRDEMSTYLYHLSLALLTSFAGYFASGTFISVLYYPHYWYLTSIIVAAVRVTQNTLTFAPSHPEDHRRAP